MLIGDSGVGKTCILVRFKNNTFLGGSFISTVGIDFRVSTDYLLAAENSFEDTYARCTYLECGC